MYADALQNPPLLVVTDLRSIVVHTNFTNTVKREIRFTVDQLDDYATRQILDAVFNNPEALRPGITRTAITQEAAEKFTRLAQALRARKHDPHAVAHFLNRLVFCDGRLAFFLSVKAPSAASLPTIRAFQYGNVFHFSLTGLAMLSRRAPADSPRSTSDVRLITTL